MREGVKKALQECIDTKEREIIAITQTAELLDKYVEQIVEKDKMIDKLRNEAREFGIGQGTEEGECCTCEGEWMGQVEKHKPVDGEPCLLELPKC